jgi:DNA modification methylase
MRSQNLSSAFSKVGIMERFLNKITCGDNCDLLGLLPRGCIDLVVTSPPYDDLRTYGGHTWDFYGVAWQLKRVLKLGGVIVWVGADATKDGSETCTSMEQALFFRRLGLNVHDTMIYMKDAPQFPDANRYGQVWEYAFVLSAGKPKTWNPIEDRKNVSFGRTVAGTNRNVDGTTRKAACFGQAIKEIGQRFNVWQYPSTKGNAETKHPAPFPEQLAKDHILSWSNPGDIVLDPFSGSGTTAKAAKELERQYIGFEINPAYCEIGEARTAQEVLSFATV